MQKIGFAIIDCGRIAPKHIEPIRNSENARLIAVCDIIRERAIKFVHQYNCDWHTDYKEIIGYYK